MDFFDSEEGFNEDIMKLIERFDQCEIKFKENKVTVSIHKENIKMDSNIKESMNFGNKIKLEIKVQNGIITDFIATTKKEGKTISLEHIKKIMKEKYINKAPSLVEVYKYFLMRLPTLYDYCVICDQEHKIKNKTFSCVCDQELCRWSYQVLGVAHKFSLIIPIEVIKMLWNFLYYCAYSPRKELVLNPFPHVYHPVDRNLIMSDSKKDFNLLKSSLDIVGSFSDKETYEEFKMMINKSLLASVIFDWIILSNQTFIRPIQSELKIQKLQSSKQFLMLYNSKEKFDYFKALKRKYGSFYGFHGSSFENWHSIIRNGLVNASGTSLQVNGAVYGSGVYISSTFNYSIHYSRGNGVEKCFCVCEIIKDEKFISRNSNILVIKNPDMVATRILVFYDNNYAGVQPDINGETDLNFINEMDNCIQSSSIF